MILETVQPIILNKEFTFIDGIQILVSVVTLVVVAYTAYQNHKLWKTTSEIFETEHIPYCTVQMNSANMTRHVSPDNGIMYLVIDFSNYKNEFGNIEEVGHYLANGNKKDLIALGTNDRFVLDPNSTLTKHFNLKADAFLDNEKYIVEIKYSGVTGKQYYYRSIYSYEREQRDDLMNKTRSMKFDFNFIKSITANRPYSW
jgi:hypothetical protein